MYERELASSLANVAVRKGSRGFTFEDLAGPVRAGRVSIVDVTDWLADARSTGFVAEMGFDPGVGEERFGPRRYRLNR